MNGASTTEDDRKATRRRAYDALMASAKGLPLEAAIARYAAEMGLTPEDPVWQEAAPVLFAMEATRNHLIATTIEVLEENIGPAIRESLIAIGDEPLTKAFVRQTSSGSILEGIETVVQTAQKSINNVQKESLASIASVRGAMVWWQPTLAASLAALVIGLGGFAEARYIRESVTAQVAQQAYSSGYRDAARQIQHPRNPGNHQSKNR